MASGKARDDKYFNTAEEHEYKYVSDLYGSDAGKVDTFLRTMVGLNQIKNMTHAELYELIESSMDVSRG